MAQGTRLFAATTLAPLQHLCPVAREGDRDKVYFLAAAGDGAVALYRDTKEVHRIETGEPLRAMLCGAYGREPCALVRDASRTSTGDRTDPSWAQVTVGMSGGLAVRIMRRQAQLDKLGTETRAPAEQEVPLPVPKKTKAYIEQTQREREQAAEMHRAFQVRPSALSRCEARIHRCLAHLITEGLVQAAAGHGAGVREGDRERQVAGHLARRRARGRQGAWAGR